MSYYQSADPTWGTSSFRFGPPPAPSFQPQPSWNGLDYYNAHAVSPDPSLYQHAWNRVSSNSCVAGVGTHEAKQLHRLAYGGQGEVQGLNSHQLGHAAAYEAYRTWTHNSSMYAPISSDRMRQREALIGLAIAEVSRIWHHRSRVHGLSRREACEAAAATASVLFSVFTDDGYDAPYSGQHSHHSIHRSRSFSGHGYPVENHGYDDDVYSRKHSHRRSRRSSTSSNQTPYYGAATSNAMPIPGAVGMPNMATSYGGNSPYHTGTSPYNLAAASSYDVTGNSPYHSGNSPYHHGGGSPYGAGLTSFPGQNSYAQPLSVGSYTQPSVYGVPTNQGTTLVIQQPQSSSSGHRRHHKYGSGHKHRSHRHRSHSDAAPTYPASTYRY